MKKSFLLLALVALLAMPVAAYAAAEFTLGGYIKFESDWDSTQINKNLTENVLRNNNPNYHHGRLKLTSNSTRFNLNLKGPKLWGAQITGLIEVDFDANGGGVARTDATGGLGTSFRMRHAMFRLNWPETELLFGQYWGYFSSFTPETAQDSGQQFTGSPTQRLPQVRLTQTFLGAYTVSGLIGAPLNSAQDPFANTNPAGESTESPQLQGMFKYEANLWGKAAFYGVPRGFVAQMAAGWQRTRFRSGGLGAQATFGQDQFNATAATSRQRDQQYLNNWMLQWSLFIPVIPTTSANLAGTASISTQWNLGQGLGVFGEALDGNTTYLMFSGVDGAGNRTYDRQLSRQFTGFVQGQYYFTNHWFLNATWGMARFFGISRDTDPSLVSVANPTGYKYLTLADQIKLQQQYDLTLWYRPIQAIKFGLQYSYVRSDFLQRASAAPAAAPNGRGVTDIGENHRVMLAGFYYF